MFATETAKATSSEALLVSTTAVTSAAPASSPRRSAYERTARVASGRAARPRAEPASAETPATASAAAAEKTTSDLIVRLVLSVRLMRDNSWLKVGAVCTAGGLLLALVAGQAAGHRPAVAPAGSWSGNYRLRRTSDPVSIAVRLDAK